MVKYNINYSIIIYPNAEGWEKIRQIMSETYKFHTEDEFEAFFRSHVVETGAGYKDQIWSIMQDLGEIFFNGSNYLETTQIKLVDSPFPTLPKYENGKHYMPLPDYLAVEDSKVAGKGLFATKDIPAGTNMGVSHLDYPGMPNGLFRSPLGGFYNHSQEPNIERIEKEGYSELVTLRDIKKGEELFAEYKAYNPEA